MADDKTKLDDIDLDDDLNFDDGLDLDAGDFSSKDDRKPTTKFAAGFLTGVKDLSNDKSFIKRTVLESLPREYSMAADAVESTMDAGKSLYDTTMAEASQSVREAKRLGRVILPKVRKRMPDKLGDRVEKYLEESEKEEQAAKKARGLSADEQISSGLNDVFRENMRQESERSEEDKAKDVIRERLTANRHSDLMSAAAATANSVGRLVSYQDSITQRYQKKNLEIQYRQLFVQRDLLENFKAFAADSLRGTSDVVKNTALPEARKIQLLEMSGQRVREGLVESAHDKAANYLGRFRENITTRLGEQIKGFGEGLRDALEMGGDLADTMGEMDDDEMGPDKTVLSGEIAGSTVGSWLAKQVARRVRPYMERNKTIMENAHRMGYFLENMPGLAKEWLDKGYQEPPELAFDDNGKPVGYYDENGEIVKRKFTGRMVDTISRVTSNFVRDFRVRDPQARITDNMLEDSERQAIFNIQTRKTINEVIPGYLSRIHHELSIIRSGDNSLTRTVYDPVAQEFIDVDTHRERVKESVTPEDQRERVRNTLDKMVERTEELSGQKFSAEAQEAFRQHIADLAQSQKSFKSDRYNKKGAQIVSGVSDQTNEELRQMLQATMLDEDGKLRSQEDRRRMADQLRDVRRYMPNLEQNLKTQASLGNTEALRELGLVSERGIQLRALRRSRLTDEKLRRRDYFSARTGRQVYRMDQIDGDVVNSSGRIVYHAPKRIQGGEFINQTQAIRQLVNPEQVQQEQEFSRGLDHTKTAGFGVGRMDQNDPLHGRILGTHYTSDSDGGSVSAGTESASLGEKVPPGFSETERSGLIEAVYEIRDSVVGRISNEPKRPGEGKYTAPEDLTPEHIETQTDTLGRLLSDQFTVQNKLGEETQSRLSDIVDILRKGVTIRGVGKASGKGGQDDEHSDSLVRRASSAITSGLEGLMGFYKSTFKGMGSLFGGGLGGAGDILKGVGSRTKDWLMKKKEDIFDVYVAGNPEPVLDAMKIRMGHYRDKVTGEIIRSMDQIRDLKNAVVDISDNNREVITLKDIAEGLYTKDRKALVRRGMGFLTKAYSKMFGWAFKPFKAVGGFAKEGLSAIVDRLKGMKPGKSSKVLDTLLSQMDVYSDKTKEVIRSIKDWDGSDLVNAKGEVIMKAKDVQKALGDQAKTTSRAIIDGILDFTGGAFRTGKAAVKGVWNTWSDLLGKGAGMLGDTWKGVMGRLGGSRNTEGKTTKDYRTRHLDMLGQIHDLLVERLPEPKRKKRHDLDGDGMREGGWREQFADREAADKAAQMSKGDGFGSKLKGGLKGLLASMGLGGLGGRGEDATEEDGDNYIGIDASGDDDDKDKKNKKNKGKPRGRMGRMWDGLKRGGGKLAKWTGLSALAGGAKSLLGGAWGATKWAATRALPAVAMGAVKGVGAVASGLASVISAPVLIGGLVAAGAAYGGYKLYRHLTDVKPGLLASARWYQYGFSPEADQDYLKPIKKLEELLFDKVKVSGNNGKLNPSDETLEEIVDLFDIDDQNGLRSFASWMENRFKPVFVTHVAALKNIAKGSVGLDEVDEKLTMDQKEAYLKAIRLPEEMAGGVYGNRATPFRDQTIQFDYNAVVSRLKKIKDALKELRRSGVAAKGDSKATEAAATAVSANVSSTAIKDSLDPTGSAKDDKFTVAPTPKEKANLDPSAPLMFKRTPGDSPQDYVTSTADGKLTRTDRIVPVAQGAGAIAVMNQRSSDYDRIKESVEKEPPSVGVHSRRDPVMSLGGGYAGSLGQPSRPGAQAETMASQEVSKEQVKDNDIRRYHQQRVAQEAKATEAQSKRVSETMSSDVKSMLNVLTKSYQTQQSMDSSLRGIRSTIDEMRKVQKDKDREEELFGNEDSEGFFKNLFGGSETKEPKPTPDPVANLQKEL